MTGFAGSELVAYALAIAVVLAVTIFAARVIRRSSRSRVAAPTGGELGRSLLEEHGLGGVEVREGDVDAYHAASRVIKLADGRFAHGSPAAWAVAALEVAHAQQHDLGSEAWRRRWRVSGYAVWAGPLLLLVLLAQLVVTSILLVVAGFALAAVLARSWVLSVNIERQAAGAAREMLESRAPSLQAWHETERPLRWASRAYMAESVFDLGLLDRAAEPYRGDARMGGAA